MFTRLLVLTAFLLGTSAYLHGALQPERVPLREPLASLPRHLDGWATREDAPLTKDVLSVLGVDDYLNRVYVGSPREFVSLYVGYYQSQRQGDSIHSPMNCLPGAGWQPIKTGRMDITVPDRVEPITVNQVTIEKGIDHQLVLYWYQSHGRVVASEYWSKIFMVTDAIRTHRSDAALVRVITPILSSDAGGAAEERAVRFVRTVFPQLSHYLPS